ncbi:MAG: PTS sugar transporter subunit IIA [Chlamydiales bacterium]
MQISHYMDLQLVTFSDSENRDDVLKQLVHMTFQAGKIPDENQFYQAIVDRETIVSTGIGMGVAIPHAKLHSLDHFFIAIGILRKPVNWLSLDGAPVRIVFMIGGPDDKQTEYLQILSHLTQAIKDEETRKKLLILSKSNEIIELFKAF